MFFCVFFAFEKVSIHVAISCPTIQYNLTHCYQFIPISYSSIVLVLLIYTILPKITNLTIIEYNTGIFLYTSIVHNTSISVLWSPSTGDPNIFKK